MLNRGRITGSLASAVLAGVGIAPFADAETLVSSPFKGVTHYQITETSPRPIVINLLEIDLTDPDLSFFTNPSNGAAADETNKSKTSTFVTTYGLEVGINAGFFNTGATNGDLNSVAISNGAGVSPWAGGGDTSQIGLNITQGNVAAVVRPVNYSNADFAIREFPTTTPVAAWTTVAGNRRIINAGVPTTTNDTNGAVNRTAAGVNEAKTKLFLITVDGRQTGYSEGMTIPEVANLLDSYGAHYAINLDGGGSTTMAFADRSTTARLVNSPSDSGGERSVANSLGFHAVRYPQWNVNASSTWTTAANWANGIPNSAGAAAHFKDIIGSDRTVTLNGDKTVGRVTFDDGNRYTLTGSILKFDVTSGTAKVDVLQATHYIDSMIQLEDGLDVQVASAGTLRLSGINNAAGKVINKVGLGTLTINAGAQTHGTGAVLNAIAGVVNMNVNAGSEASANLTINADTAINFATKQNLAALNVAAGATAKMAAGGANALAVNTLSATAGGKIDLANNDMVARNLTLGTVQNLLKSGFNDGAWTGTGINSSNAASDPNGLTTLGYASNAELGFSSFSGVTGLDGNDILIKYTYYGDADLSGDTSLDDFFQFLAGYNSVSSDTWYSGDFNYSGNTTLDDFFQFLNGYNNQGDPLSALANAVEMSSLSASEQQSMLNAIAAVPEPATVSLLAVAGVGMLSRRRRR